VSDGQRIVRQDMLWGFPPFRQGAGYGTNFRSLNNICGVTGLTEHIPASFRRRPLPSLTATQVSRWSCARAGRSEAGGAQLQLKNAYAGAVALGSLLRAVFFAMREWCLATAAHDKPLNLGHAETHSPPYGREGQHGSGACGAPRESHTATGATHRAPPERPFWPMSFTKASHDDQSRPSDFADATNRTVSALGKWVRLD
jgi:hypothetical protein